MEDTVGQIVKSAMVMIVAFAVSYGVLQHVDIVWWWNAPISGWVAAVASDVYELELG